MNAMTCIEFRQRVGAEPHSRESEVLRHRLECRACGEHARGLETLDRRLAAALRLPVPAELAHRAMLRATGEPLVSGARQAFAAAAMVALVAVGVALGVGWQRAAVPAPLDSDLLAHLHHEPETLVPSAVTVAAHRVREVLRDGGARLADEHTLGEVSYARLCPFRGETVPHLVFQGARGPVTVMLLPHEHVTAPTPFDEGGYRGVIVPAGRGSIAIIGVDDPSVALVRDRVTRSVALTI
jgi:hypothetical protein